MNTTPFKYRYNQQTDETGYFAIGFKAVQDFILSFVAFKLFL